VWAPLPAAPIPGRRHRHPLSARCPGFVTCHAPPTRLYFADCRYSRRRAWRLPHRESKTTPVAPVEHMSRI
jgi:hypothetical protein